MVLILGNDPDLSTRLGGILSARHGFRGTAIDRPRAILISASQNSYKEFLRRATFLSAAALVLF